MLVDAGMLRLATEIEVGQNTPLLQRSNFLNDESRHMIGDPQKPVPSAGGIGENDHEENGRLATPVISQSGYDVDNIRHKPLGRPCYCSLE